MDGDAMIEDTMVEFDFCGYACLPANPMGECLDAAGVDTSLKAASPSGAHDMSVPPR
jgi:hypothetical protein